MKLKKKETGMTRITEGYGGNILDVSEPNSKDGDSTPESMDLAKGE